MVKYNSKQAKILTNITYNEKLIKALSSFGLRLFFADSLYIAWDVCSFDALQRSNEKCTTYFTKLDILKLVYAFNDDFSLLIEFNKTDKYHYTYKNINYINKKTKEKYSINVPKHVKALKRRKE